MSDLTPEKPTIYLECACYNPFHMIRLESLKEYDEKSITIHVYRYKTFFQRLKACFKYLFTESELDYDSVLIRPEDVPKFKEWLNED